MKYHLAHRTGPTARSYTFCGDQKLTNYLQSYTISLYFSNPKMFQTSLKVVDVIRHVLCHALTFGTNHSEFPFRLFFFNVYHPEVFNTYMNIQCISQTQPILIGLFYYLGQHVSTLIESSSGPSKIQILTNNV